MFVFLIILYGNPFTVRFHLPFSQSDSIYPFYSQIPYTPFTVRFHLLQLESDSIYPFDIQIPSNPFSVRFHETFDKPQCDPRAGTPSGVPRLRARIYHIGATCLKSQLRLCSKFRPKTSATTKTTSRHVCMCTH